MNEQVVQINILKFAVKIALVNLANEFGIDWLLLTLHFVLYC